MSVSMQKSKVHDCGDGLSDCWMMGTRGLASGVRGSKKSIEEVVQSKLYSLNLTVNYAGSLLIRSPFPTFFIANRCRFNLNERNSVLYRSMLAFLRSDSSASRLSWISLLVFSLTIPACFKKFLSLWGKPASVMST